MGPLRMLCKCVFTCGQINSSKPTRFLVDSVGENRKVPKQALRTEAIGPTGNASRDGIRIAEKLDGETGKQNPAGRRQPYTTRTKTNGSTGSRRTDTGSTGTKTSGSPGAMTDSTRTKPNGSRGDGKAMQGIHASPTDRGYWFKHCFLRMALSYAQHGHLFFGTSCAGNVRSS